MRKINKVLIVEDDMTNTFLLKRFLEGIKVCTREQMVEAKDGKEAISMSNDKDINLIFMDMRMPTMNGYDATKEIKRIHPEIIIIGISGELDQEKLKGTGIDDIIEKPVIIKVLKEKVEKFFPPAE